MRYNTRNTNQYGMVSIVITMLMMLVITLIVLGFAQVSRREVRESLDRQLSASAFFAAESGINDAGKAINQALSVGGSISDKTQCGPDGNYPADPKIDPANNVSYTCLLVSTQLPNLTANVNANANSTVLHLEPAAGKINTLHIVWNANTVPTAAQIGNCKAGVPASSSFPSTSSGNWKCPYGLLRLDLIPTDTLDRVTMSAGQVTVFLYPTTAGAGTVAYGTANGTIAAMRCPSSGTGCTIDITGMGGTASSGFAARFNAVYNSGRMTASATDLAGGGVNFKNGQVMIDATGRAQDVLRRVQVRMPLSVSSTVPAYAIESGSSICKRFEISNGIFLIPNDIKGQDMNNPLCKPASVTTFPPASTNYLYCADPGAQAQTYYFDFRNFPTPFSPDWHVNYHDPGSPAHPIANTPYTNIPGGAIPAGNYHYSALSQDTSWTGSHLSLHYVFFDSSGNVVAKTQDTSDASLSPAGIFPPEGSVSGTITLGTQVTSIKPEHAADVVPAPVDDSIDGACMVLEPM